MAKPKGGSKLPPPIKDKPLKLYDHWTSENGLAVISQWMRNGATMQDVADKIGINKTTLYEWKRRYPNLCDALDNSREYADMLVENALFKRALGFSYSEITKEGYTDKNGNPQVKVKEVTKYIYPDPTSMMFWLKNRQPEKWKDRHETVVSSVEYDENTSGVLDKLSEAIKEFDKLDKNIKQGKVVTKVPTPKEGE